MADIKIYSFTPKKVPAPMALRETPKGKAGPASIPHDVFLNIIDFLIADATGWETSTTWKVDYNHGVPLKLVVTEEVIAIVKPKQSTSQMTRYTRALIPSQLNRRTRAAVNRVLPRAPMISKDGKRLACDAWIRPDIDRFIPVCRTGSRKLREQELRFRQAIMLPTPQGAVLTGSIQRIFIPVSSYLSKTNADSVAALAALPNLREITLWVGSFYPDLNELVCHGGLRSIDPRVFPDLAAWARTHGPDFASVYHALEKRGIKLYAGLREIGQPYLEILDTKKGVRARVIDANCTCCGADKLY
ncbi:hypothetical protein ColTof4_13998 [Colletotrichum tofieldiae]|nr:hypothetical protein ColTof3_14630 [Colletotrichum tofieldiae]GKT81575.1 hypothetical protein ColTof4_13998 [Colletotrichum tofieldiae]